MWSTRLINTKKKINISLESEFLCISEKLHFPKNDYRFWNRRKNQVKIMSHFGLWLIWPYPTELVQSIVPSISHTSGFGAKIEVSIKRICKSKFTLWNANKCDFFKRGYRYSGCAISRTRHPVEVKLLDEFLAKILILYKIKTVEFWFLFPNQLSNVRWVVISFVKCTRVDISTPNK